jgi:hypothetical protein
MKLSFLFNLKIITFWLLLFNFANFSHAQIATEPIVAPTWISAKNVTAYSMELNWESVGEGVNYLVLWSVKPIVAFPIDGKTYQKGDWIGAAKVAYNGKQSYFVPNGVRANTSYYIRVFPFNGTSTTENYLTSQGIEKMIKSKGLFYGDYYQGLSMESESFLLDLGMRLQQHQVIEYSAYKSTLLESVELLDTSGNRRFIQCVYTGHQQIVEGAFDWVKSGFSREHTFSHSWMPSYPANNPYKMEYSDLHNLYPTHLANANTKRSNYPLDEVTGTIIYQYKEGRLGYKGSQIVYEPSDKQKGNAARAIFYMILAYDGVDGKMWRLPENQDQNILKKWHFKDPPDSFEISRQEYIYKAQGNRNPFIDSADFVCAIDFKNFKPVKCESIYSVNDSFFSSTHFKVTNGVLECGKMMDKISVFSMDGKMIGYNQNCFSIDLKLMCLNINNIYLLCLEIDGKKYFGKIYF